MHAYLFVGQGITNYQIPISNLAKKLHAKVMEYPLSKIEDVRSLNNLIRLSFNEPTLIISEDIHEATEEALNAFLKNLEEPQENIYFALTAPTVRKVLPTITSRCEIIKITNDKLQKVKEGTDDALEFAKMTIGKKLSYIDKIRNREEAAEFTESLVNYYHNLMHTEESENLKIVAERVEASMSALGKIKANGNISLTLTNLVINLT